MTTVDMPHVRHFTATGFVVHDDNVALHWHPKVQAWLPPGGHIEDNEDPVDAVVREVEEESGLRAEVVPTGQPFDLEYPTHVHPPFTIMVEDIHDPVDGYHQHIDMIYMLQLVGPAEPLNHGWQWVSRLQLADAVSLEYEPGRSAAPPEDVRVLAAHAFEVVGAAHE